MSAVSASLGIYIVLVGGALYLLMCVSVDNMPLRAVVNSTNDPITDGTATLADPVHNGPTH